MKKRSLVKRGAALSLAVTLGAFSGVTADTSVVMAAEPAVKLNQYGLAENVEDGSILHCWCWSFNETF